MSDRELLEKAAKAAGIDLYVEWDESGPTGNYRNGPDGDSWNPLEDNGDALRLAVKLAMMIDFITKAGSYMQGHVVAVADGHACYEVGFHEEATRRAIVRVAAAIGERK